MNCDYLIRKPVACATGFFIDCFLNKDILYPTLLNFFRIFRCIQNYIIEIAIKITEVITQMF